MTEAAGTAAPGDGEDLLVEVGTEELPPRSVRALSEAFGREIEAGLDCAGIAHGASAVFATPRRLAVHVAAVSRTQPDRLHERRGPAVKDAFDAGGAPTRAAEGFARSCGVPVEALERLETEQGAWLVFRSTEIGQQTRSLLPEIVSGALARLPVPRRMRWGGWETEFVRPAHWVVVLLGREVAAGKILGVSIGRHTAGHRFHHPRPIPVEDPAGYAAQLYGDAHVIADFDKRRDTIRRQVEEAAAQAGGRALVDDELLEEVTSMVEWPSAIAGSYDEEFLALPEGVLVAVMKGHQRYFPVADGAGKLLPRFIVVVNLESRNPDVIREGNERVIRPRLKDAAFFFRRDLQRSLESRLDELEGVVFQERLGSMHDKARRVSRLAGTVAIALGEPPDVVKLARRAGLLCKCDLMTEMVGEFPELQGVMGREFAARGGEPEAVAVALEEAYMPRVAGDRVPESVTGRAVALADRLDTLVGIFGIGETPTGEGDPFALRRAALGVLRIAIEGELDLDLRRLLHDAAENLDKSFGVQSFTDDAVIEPLARFVNERLRGYFAEQGIPADVFAAVAAREPRRPFDFAARVHAVDAFRTLPEAESLAAANKRIKNILKQAEGEIPERFSDSLFTEDAEWNLAAQLVGLGPGVRDLLKKREYAAALRALAGLRDNVDAFFDTVKVMTDDEQVRRNRLALLGSIGGLFLETADISLLQSRDAS